MDHGLRRHAGAAARASARPFRTRSRPSPHASANTYVCYAHRPTVISAEQAHVSSAGLAEDDRGNNPRSQMGLSPPRARHDIAAHTLEDDPPDLLRLAG